MKDGHLVANGGRVLAVAALGDNLNAALTRGYEAVSAIQWMTDFFGAISVVSAPRVGKPTLAPRPTRRASA